MIKVSVTEKHINEATYPSNSPVALALREMGFSNVSVSHLHAYINTKVYALPEQATASEKAFDYLAKGGSSQGEIAENIKPYEFVLEELKQNV